MGRPRLSRDQTKDKYLSVRFTAEEIWSLEKKAERQGISLSEFTRKTLLSAVKETTILDGARGS
jgi:predicted HicB family RNase H-like nuclease